MLGLLHDIGRFVLYLEAPDELREVDETAWSTPQQLVEAEAAKCGFTQAELGYLVIRKWHLADELADVVKCHHSQPESIPEGLRPTIQLVQDTDWMSVAFGVHQYLWSTLSYADLECRLDGRATAGMDGMASKRIAPIVREALRQSSRMQSALGLAI